MGKKKKKLQKPRKGKKKKKKKKKKVAKKCREGKTLVARPLKKHYMCVSLRDIGKMNMK